MILPDLKKSYKSEIDEFLAELAREFPEPSASQQAEITKHHRVTTLRDEKKSD